jgi:hypothetical protein
MNVHELRAIGHRLWSGTDSASGDERQPGRTLDNPISRSPVRNSSTILIATILMIGPVQILIVFQ